MTSLSFISFLKCTLIISFVIKVAEANKAPEALDIKAEQTAAKTSPNIPGGRIVNAKLVKADCESPKLGRTMSAHIPTILRTKPLK